MNNSNDPPPIPLSLASGVEFSARLVGDRTSYVAHQVGSGKYFRFGSEEHHLTTLIDGTRTASEIFALQEADGMGWSHEEVAQFLGQLIQHKIVIPKTPEKSVSAESESSNKTQPPAPSPIARVTTLLSLLVSQRIPLLSGHRVAARFAPLFGPCFSTSGMVVWSLMVMSALALVYGHWDAFHGEVQSLFDPGIWPILIVIWLLSKVVHEIGHAVAAHRQGVRIGQMGIMFFLFAPLAYVDVTDAWKLKSRLRRVQIALAGVYLELGIASIAAWAWWFLPDGLLRHLSAQVFLVAGPTTLLVNANPLLRLDGYYVLSDLLEIPNLRMHGRKQLGGFIERWLMGMKPAISLLAGWRRDAATIHAAASVVFQFFWMGGLIIAVSMWARGLGILLGAAALLLWGILPLSRWIYKIWTLDPPENYLLNAKRKRLLTVVAMLLTCIHYFSTAASPFDRRVPVVVRFRDEQISRAVADAFVAAVYVKNGQRVVEGELLIELSQPELLIQREDTLDDIELADQQSIQHRRKGQIALADAKIQEVASLARRIIELDARIEGLSIRAKREGLVTTPGTDKLVGRYVRLGDELIRVSDPNEKEILAAVGERDIQAYQIAVDQGGSATIRLRGGAHIAAEPVRLLPRARRSLPHPAMSASAGGPLAVEPSSNPNRPMQLVQPKLESVTPLDPVTSASVSAGQLGAMTISDNRSLMTRLYDAVMPEKR